MANDNYLNLTGLRQFFNKLKNLFATKEVATALSDGLMSLSDKEKLDGIARKANNYTHPDTSGCKHIPSGGASGQILAWSADGTAKWVNNNGTIDGITDSLTSTSSTIALSAKAGNSLQNQISELNTDLVNLTPQNIGAFPHVRLPDDTDVNTVITPGVYYVYTNVNSFFGYQTLLVFETDNRWITQIAIEENDTFSIAMRCGNVASGAWDEWTPIGAAFLPRHAKADAAAVADIAITARNANAIAGVTAQNTDPGIDRTYHLAADGGVNPIQWIHRNNMCVGHLGANGEATIPMTFYWNGQPGQPTWLWGGNDNPEHNMYVWNPANFYVNRANFMTTQNVSGNFHGDALTLACRHNLFSDNRFGLFIDGRTYQVRVDYASEADTAKDVNFIHGGFIHSDSAYRMFISASSNPEYGVYNGLLEGTAPMWTLCPAVNGNMSLGSGSYRWEQLYINSPVISTSDSREKNSIALLDDELIQKFILGLKPVSYKMNEGTSGRTHYGIIAQDIEQLLCELGLSSFDFAGFIKSPKTQIADIKAAAEEETNVEPRIIEEEYIYGLRYEEFISPLIKMVQLQQQRIESLEKRLEALDCENYAR